MPSSPQAIDDIPITIARALHIIEHEGNLSKAAKLLGVSQPAISKGVTLLETQLKVALIRRGSRPLQLTDEGREIAQYAIFSDQLRENTFKNIEQSRLNQKGIVKIGSIGASASTHILPNLIKKLSNLYPDIELQINEAPDKETMSDLQQGRIDIAIMTEPVDEEIETLPITSDRLVALIPTNHRLSEKASLCATDIDGNPFIMTTGGSSPFVLEWFQQAQITPLITHSILQITSILALVKAKSGISIVAELALPPKLDGVTAIPLHPEKTRHLVFARNRTTSRSQSVETVWKHCEKITFET
ncbi:LysR family transcriptional regulator [Curvivirga sp.]|uniref:LysR family transcriptional regulator n=1 Tax=Curvivirga sp. TaxID=2856848 RepID=UPI003B5BAF21